MWYHLCPCFCSFYQLLISQLVSDILGKILICNVFLFRIERLELFDEFEEWYMMQASQLLISVVKEHSMLNIFGESNLTWVDWSPP